MKIRSGFVSNSSSSSFIIDANKYTCADIAKDMAKELYCGEYDYKEGENVYKEFCDNLDKLENKNTPMFIECCDDVRIWKLEDKIYVEGSYHYEWGLDFIDQGEECQFRDLCEDVDWYFPKEDNKYLGKHLYSWDIQKQYPDFDSYKDKCECGGSTWIEIKSGEIMCAKCCRKPDGKFINIIEREQKLKRVSNLD